MTNRKSEPTVAEMEEQRRELDRQIRAKKRAERKAAEEHLLMLRQALGVDLAEAVGADTPELVEALGRVLMEEQMLQQLQRGIAQDARTAQSSQTPSGVAESSDTSTVADDRFTVAGGGLDDRD